MPEPIKVTQIFLDIGGLVHCRGCGKAMTLDAGSFVCISQSSRKCHATPVDAEWLVRSVVSKVVGQISTGETMDRIEAKIREMCDPATRAQEEKLDSVEHEISELNSVKANILADVEQGNQNYQDQAEAIDKVNMYAAGLAYEALVAREELDKINFMVDWQGVRQTAGDMKTYLDSEDPELVQELLELMVQQVQIGPGEVVIIYPGDGRETDRVQLD